MSNTHPSVPANIDRNGYLSQPPPGSLIPPISVQVPSAIKHPADTGSLPITGGDGFVFLITLGFIAICIGARIKLHNWK